MKVEELRSILYKKLAENDKLTDSTVVELSQELDAALIDYHFKGGKSKHGEYRKISAT